MKRWVCSPKELFVRHSVGFELSLRFPREETGELLVEGDEVLRILAALSLVLPWSESALGKGGHECLTVFSKESLAHPRNTCVIFHAKLCVSFMLAFMP
jgi:hypothetical protein